MIAAFTVISHTVVLETRWCLWSFTASALRPNLALRLIGWEWDEYVLSLKVDLYGFFKTLLVCLLGNLLLLLQGQCAFFSHVVWGQVNKILWQALWILMCFRKLGWRMFRFGGNQTKGYSSIDKALVIIVHEFLMRAKHFTYNLLNKSRRKVIISQPSS